MATSGTYNESIENADLLAEAYERIGKDPDSMAQRHITTALRSLTFLFADWENDGVSQYRIETFTLASADGFVKGASSLTLEGRVIRVLYAVHRDSGGVNSPLLQIGRMDYDYLAKKDQTGNRPDRFYLDRKRDAPVINLWPIIDNSNDTLLVTALVTTQDVGELSDSPDIPRLWWEAIASGLAARLAEKFAPERLSEKIELAISAFSRAKREDRETGPTSFRMRGWGGRR